MAIDSLGTPRMSAADRIDFLGASSGPPFGVEIPRPTGGGLGASDGDIGCGRG
jgi:hypothetical protein